MHSTSATRFATGQLQLQALLQFGKHSCCTTNLWGYDRVVSLAAVAERKAQSFEAVVAKLHARTVILFDLNQQLYPLELLLHLLQCTRSIRHDLA